ncbi:DegT/DnrJ/EryC1/StrS aminotransferase family protein [Empedobacter falsenii]|uniref:DegT/DnrJ/EryC1/StrS family aminotransferase n=1 Tax=Empedobacter falsenii TaxID=343874 RepID=UPI0025773FF1|nr:DegT/DnrJ/EryC1/StrS family aminotransferase [Empedobacter falsenii]MDM1298600.1 DegT/DnrJ/EryC1/StrS aminotransferase family protein [Empedobacter falsenii]MDM1318393.1 DegT/DnrJ/EryC1/StrS aminotransferase family protein [Empedobacter falsenii]
MPSYIGWSPNEGSGIFDSVKNSSLEFDFYHLDRELQIDSSHLKQKVQEHTHTVVLLVHYFGFPDKKYQEIVQWLKENNIQFVEDCAHAFLSDVIGGTCGRNGRYSFYSLHKMLPVSVGGVMVCNDLKDQLQKESIQPFVQLDYDLLGIYSKRRHNYNKLVEALIDTEGIEVIYPILEEGICPQTLPVIVNNFDRNLLYSKMNEAGIGMVSLYHTMIDELKECDALAARFTSQHIINFPVHQDMNDSDIEQVITVLKSILHV